VCRYFVISRLQVQSSSSVRRHERLLSGAYSRNVDKLVSRYARPIFKYKHFH
jgi:hypothetical protein